MRIKFLVAIILASLPQFAISGGLPPAEALLHMKPAVGFRVDLVACEPEIRQPVTMSFDSRGRLWVIQYLQYPNPAGLKAVKADQYLRTTYDRVPEPPPKGPRGADRITICEDTDGDGRMDKFKDFVVGLNLASGMALAPDGVYVLQAPYLLFYPDRNHDDIPDGNPEVLLTGFGMEDAHAVANSLIWGPDGWLYGAQGSTVTANIRGITFQQGVWRYHPRTRRFELFAEGGGNIWGLDFDRHGNLFAGTNWGGFAMMHVVQGGYYVKGFEKHGPLHNPYAFGYFDHVPYKDFRGGHVTCGGIIYQGGAFPKEFDGAYIAANLLSNAIHWHKLIPYKSTFKAEFGGELLTTDDICFRPIDCTVGPDGALYVADWYDKRANHVDPVDDWDKSTGRIYRVAPIRSRKSNSNGSGFPTETEGHHSFGIKVYGDDLGLLQSDPGIPKKMHQLAVRETDPNARCQFAATARRLPVSVCRRVLSGLLKHEEDADDPFIPLMIWWAFEAKINEDRLNAIGIFSDTGIWNNRIVREHLIERVARRFAAAGTADDWQSCAAFLLLAPSPADRDRIWSGVELGTVGRSFQKTPQAMAQIFDQDMLRSPQSSIMTRLALRFQRPGAFERLSKTLAADQTPDAEKQVVIAALAQMNSPATLAILNSALDFKLSESTRIKLISSLERSGDPGIATRLLDEFMRGSSKLRGQAIASLLARPSWAMQLLDAIDVGAIPQSAISDAGLQKLAGFRDAALTARVEKRWGKIKPPSPGEVKARIHGVCVTVRMAKGDRERGHGLFKENCGNCHKLFGEGNAVGPELTGLDRRNLDFLVSNVVEPSAIIRKEFTAHIVSTTDGRVLTGLIAEQSADAVTLLDAKNQKIVLPRSEIESIRASEVSLMPEKLLDKFDHQQLRDLFAYLQSDVPPMKK